MKPYRLATLFWAVMLSVFTVNAADLEQTLYGVDIPIGGDGKLWNPGPTGESTKAGTPNFDSLFMNSTRTTGADALWAVGITGKGVTAAVVDGGFLEHEIFQGGKVVNGYTYNTVVNGSTTHGTRVSDIVLGMAPDAPRSRVANSADRRLPPVSKSVEQK